MHNIKNVIYIITLILTVPAVCMETPNLSSDISPTKTTPSFSRKIGPTESTIKFVKKCTVSAEIIDKLNKHLNCNLILENNEKNRDLLLVSTKQSSIYIFDLITGKEIIQLNGLGMQKETAYPLELVLGSQDDQKKREKNETVYLNIKISQFFGFYHFNQTISVNLLNNSIEFENFDLQENPHDPYFTCIDFGKNKTLTHSNYKLKASSDAVIVQRTSPKKEIAIKSKNCIYKSVCISPKKDSRFILTEIIYFSSPKHYISLINNHTGHTICQVESANKHSFQFPVFGKNDDFIILLFNKHISIFDLQNMKLFCKKKLTQKTSSLFLSSDEQFFGIPEGNNIIIYKNPLYKNPHEIPDKIERTHYIKENYKNFKINFINDKKIDAIKLLFFGN